MASARSAPLVRAAVIGVTGRMGVALLREAIHFPQLIISGAIAAPGSLALGRDAGTLAGLPPANLAVSDDLSGALARADVVLDFSRAGAVAAHLASCRSARKPVLIGATGFGDTLEGMLAEASRDIALLVAPNTSIGVTLLIELTRLAAAALPDSFDVDVLELHHRTKADAPSGTALALGRAAAEGRKQPFSPAPPGAVPRGKDVIGFASVRAGDAIGEHSVLFSGLSEELALRHRASDRAVFARGALAAALWLAGQRPGRYAMRDFLGFKTAT